VVNFTHNAEDAIHEFHFLSFLMLGRPLIKVNLLRS